ncbi:sulfatase-like hydrolase/transferase [uncultured Fibrobacter sp.]|uniref:sulfatase-like hydrolase/transferase n=1 Tax=uncultured Fibrobacter sp. TaxID=261512 RepID=UPI0025E5FCAB|nr:sulfatase-like hydrolase/transferase [uncultured Fibrobacter sp.]
MYRCLYLLFASLLASFGCFIAFDYFATPTLHGIINGDVLLFLLVLSQPQKKGKFKLFLLLAGVASFFFFNPVIGICVVFATAVSFIRRDIAWPSIVPIGVFFLFSIVADCTIFFKDSFMMNFAQIWEVCSFFWWGAILFFLVPLGYTTVVIWFARKSLWGTNRLILNPLLFVALALFVLIANIGVTSLQSRMLLVDFPIYRCFRDYNVYKPFDGVDVTESKISGEDLSENTKKVFEIWDSTKGTIKKKSVFVLVESYGVHKDTTIAKHMIYEPFKDTHITFSGILSRHAAHTQGAELEDLGNVNYYDSSETPMLTSMRAENVESFFLHGYLGSFYSRSEKYKSFGFDSLLFINELRSMGAKTCRYGFEGICDSSITSFIDSILHEPGDKFVFWTTLDSHPPYKSNLILPGYSVFCKNINVSEEECTYYSLIENTLKRVAALAQRHPDYQFVIRGDHRPMGTIDPDDYYFAWVPMIILN